MSNFDPKDERHNHLKNAELHLEQGHALLNGILDNLPAPEEEKPLDKVKEPPSRRRSLEREER